MDNRNCINTPHTCALVETISHLTNNILGGGLFSMMTSGTHVHPHSGPTNSRLRAHIGLDIPNNHNGVDAPWHSRIRVHNEYLFWENGEIIIFDDSFDHEVWHYNPLNHSRLVLILDLWHPDMTEYQIAINEPNYSWKGL